MSRPCRWVVAAFAVLYLAALFLLAVGTFGLFGDERDPLAAVFLVPLGLPWITMASRLPETLLPWTAILAPVVNLLLLALVCRTLGRRR